MNVTHFREEAILGPAPVEKRSLLFQRMADLHRESLRHPTYADNVSQGVNQALVNEMAVCFQEIIGENPTMEVLASAKAEFLKALGVDEYREGLQYQNNRASAERAYTRILERILTRDRKEALKPIDLDGVATVNKLVEQTRASLTPRREGGGAH